MIRPFKDKNPIVPTSAYVDESAIVIGDVTLGEHCSIWPMAVVRGDVNTIQIGNYTNIQDGSVIHTTHESEYHQGAPSTIGNFVTIGHQVIFHGCTIEDHCLIGMGSKLLDNVHVEKNVMIGAGSLVPPGKRLVSGFLYVGAPVKQIRALTPEEVAFFEYSARHYAKLKDQYLF
jgi:carbonic anhydrase/acetyltransferase-like protein (isoleucine patch superfamily)